MKSKLGYFNNQLNKIIPTKKNFTLRGKEIITYSWDVNKKTSHGICGHIFEAFELTISKQNAIFLIPDEYDNVVRIFESLYLKYSDQYINKLLVDNRIYYGKPSTINADKIILCDGQMPTDVLLNCKELELILCGRDFWWLNGKRPQIYNFLGKDITIRYDRRLEYDISLLHDFLSPNYYLDFDEEYIKDINFDLYKTYPVTLRPTNTYLVYTTGNCRDIFEADSVFNCDTLQEISEIVNRDSTVIFLGLNKKKSYDNSDAEEIIRGKLQCDVRIIQEEELPIENLFSLFNTYIYTPTVKNWDCSSRLIPECLKFNKEIIFTPTVYRHMHSNYALKIRYIDYKNKFDNTHSKTVIQLLNKINDKFLKDRKEIGEE